MKTLADILKKKQLILNYCRVFEYDNPKISLLGTPNCFNLIVDDIDAVYNGDMYLEALFSETFGCKFSVLILQEIGDPVKHLYLEKMADFEDVEKIERLFGKKSADIFFGDVEPEFLAHYETLKSDIRQTFLAKGELPPYGEEVHESLSRLRM